MADRHAIRDAVLGLPMLRDLCESEGPAGLVQLSRVDGYWRIQVWRGEQMYMGQGPSLPDAIEGLEAILFVNGELRA